MQLLANEKMIASLDNDKVELSNMRLQLANGNDYKIINLNQISFIEIEESRKITFLIISGLSFIAAFLLANQFRMESDAMPFVFIGVVFLGLYFLFVSKNIVIRSSGGTIRHKVTWIKKNDVDRFIFLVHKEINK